MVLHETGLGDQMLADNKDHRTEISIVMPAYNCSQWIAETIRSVMQQSMTKWELIVVDDGSTDDTVVIVNEMAAHEPRIRVLRQENAGPGAARNFGSRSANVAAPLIIFLDSDDIWYPETLEILSDCLEKNGDAAGAHGVADLIDHEGKPLTTKDQEISRRKYIDGILLRNLAQDQPSSFASLSYVNHIPTPGCVLLRKSALPGKEPFNTAKSSFVTEDWELWLKLCVTSHLAYTTRKVIKYRKHPAAFSAKGIPAANLISVRRAILRTPSLTRHQRFLLRYGFSLRLVRKSQLAAKEAAKALVQLKFANFASRLSESIVGLAQAAKGF
jgi:glycosyltransferase involved in cell wall biosynthesis